jgi:hypothetical protein
MIVERNDCVVQIGLDSVVEYLISIVACDKICMQYLSILDNSYSVSAHSQVRERECR